MPALLADGNKLADLLEWHARGLSQRDVAEAIGVSQRAVGEALRRLNLPPNGYSTRASRLKRSRAAREVARLRRARLHAAEPAWEAEFPLSGGAVPERLGYLAFAAMSRAGAVGHGEPGVQILPRGDRLLVRAAEGRLRDLAAALRGATLRVGGDAVRLGGPTPRPARPARALSSWCVTAKGKTDSAAMAAWLRRELARLGVGARVAVGPRRLLKVKGLVIVGYAATLARLHPRESLLVQSVGLGGRRRFGCGVFVAGKGGADRC